MTSSTVIHVGIVDNDPLTLSALVSIINNTAGCEVMWSEQSSVIAFSRCLSENECPDALLVDMSMPDLSGPALCRRIRVQTSNVPILAITSYDPLLYAEKAAKAGAQGLITKDDIQTIQVALFAVARGNTWPSPHRLRQTQMFETSSQAHKRLKQERNPFAQLSPREMEAVQLSCQHMLTITKLALMMNVSENTFKTYLRRSYQKLGVSNRRELTILWHHFIDDPEDIQQLENLKLE